MAISTEPAEEPQGEYSRNLLFLRGSELEQVFQSVVERTRLPLNVKTLKTVLGTKRRPFRQRGQKTPACEVVVEKPTYDLTVFKLHFGKITVKLNTKGEHVLRAEVIVHNATALPCGRSLPKFAEIVTRLKGILERFLNVLRGIDVMWISNAQWDDLPLASQVGQTRVGGVDINKPRMRAVIEAVIALRRYQTVPDGLQATATLLVLRDKVIQPVLAGVGKPRRGPKPKHQSPIDAHYETIRVEMRNLFQLIGIAA